MADLIDRQAAIDAITVDGYEHFSGCLSSGEQRLLELMIDTLGELPAVDAVEVVYCDKCIYSNSCKIEAMLLDDGIENPYCAGGRTEGRKC